MKGRAAELYSDCAYSGEPTSLGIHRGKLINLLIASPLNLRALGPVFLDQLIDLQLSDSLKRLDRLSHVLQEAIQQISLPLWVLAGPDTGYAVSHALSSQHVGLFRPGRLEASEEEGFVTVHPITRIPQPVPGPSTSQRRWKFLRE